MNGGWVGGGGGGGSCLFLSRFPEDIYIYIRYIYMFLTYHYACYMHLPSHPSLAWHPNNVSVQTVQLPLMQSSLSSHVSPFRSTVPGWQNLLLVRMYSPGLRNEEADSSERFIGMHDYRTARCHKQDDCHLVSQRCITETQDYPERASECSLGLLLHPIVLCKFATE